MQPQKAPAPAAPSPGVSIEERFEIGDFLTLEARLADESRYSEWEALVEDDMVYWVPGTEESPEPIGKVSIIRDNRSRLATRIRQLNTGKRHAQLPVSPMRRVISNIEIVPSGDGTYQVFSNTVLYELRAQSTNELQVWPARVEHRLRRTDRGLRMFYKKVSLVNVGQPVPSISFII